MPIGDRSGHVATVYVRSDQRLTHAVRRLSLIGSTLHACGSCVASLPAFSRLLSAPARPGGSVAICYAKAPSPEGPFGPRRPPQRPPAPARSGRLRRPSRVVPCVPLLAGASLSLALVGHNSQDVRKAVALTLADRSTDTREYTRNETRGTAFAPGPTLCLPCPAITLGSSSWPAALECSGTGPPWPCGLPSFCGCSVFARVRAGGKNTPPKNRQSSASARRLRPRNTAAGRGPGAKSLRVRNRGEYPPDPRARRPLP
jgi:hypothetical protein